MGLEDALPDDVEPSSSSSSSSTTSSGTSGSVDDDKIVVHGDSSKKRIFDEDKWERVKKLVEEEYDESLNEVLNNWSAEDRYEFIGEVAKHDTRNRHGLDQEPGEKITCEYCGKEVTVVAVELHGHVYCRNHTVGEIHLELDEDEN